jgi:general stress protein YciG
MAGNKTRGFGSMDKNKQQEIASMGGKAQGRQNNPGNFANDREKASRAGKKGGSS